MRFGATILKHFAVLSPKMMLRSLPEVVRSSKNDKTFDHGTSSCLTLAVMHGAAEEQQEGPGAQQKSPGAELVNEQATSEIDPSSRDEALGICGKEVVDVFGPKPGWARFG